MPTAAGNIDPIDPVFISYRQSDGTSITGEFAWLMRASGVPVWRDRDDLPPGDTDERLRQAIDDGLSGSAFVITPEIADSRVVREVEAPKILHLHRADPNFALGIVNAVVTSSGGTDYDAPDRLLQLDPPILRGVDQYKASRDGLIEAAEKLVFHRIASCRALVAADGGVFRLSVQTRNTPQVYDRTDSHLDIRVRPSTHERLPSWAGLIDLKDTLGLLPDCVTRAGASSVVVTGGAHLSVALAIGAALPSSRIGRVELVSQQQQAWQSGPEARFGANDQLQVVRQHTSSSIAGPPAVAAYLDLLEAGSDSAFDRFLDERSHQFTAWTQLGRTGSGLIDPQDAGEVASQAAAHIRQLSTANANAEVHLLLRCPFPMAVLIGRLTNTLRLVAYEWDDTTVDGDADYRPRYVPTLRIRASASNGAIQDVLLLE